MLKISKLADYSLLIMASLARQPETVQTATELSEQTQIALPTVGKILKILARAELVKSTRGARGGYRLQRSPQSISIIDIICAMEGPVAITECSLLSGDCRQSVNCGLKGNWQRINQAIVQTLANISLAQMMQPNGIAVQAIPLSNVQPLVTELNHE